MEFPPPLCLQTRASNLLLTIGLRLHGLGQSTLHLAQWGIAGSFRPIRAHYGHALGHDRPGRADCRVKIMPRSPGTALAHVIQYFGSFPTRFATAQAVLHSPVATDHLGPKETTPGIFLDALPFVAACISPFLASQGLRPSLLDFCGDQRTETDAYLGCTDILFAWTPHCPHKYP